MKNQLKKIFTYLIAFSFIVLISCEKDTNENPDPKAAAVPFEKKNI